MNEQTYIQRLLQKHYSLLKCKNPSYSIRGFSKKVGVAPGTLSLIMLGKRKVSEKLSQKIADNLGLDPIQKSELLSAFKKKNRLDADSSYLQLEADKYYLLTDWVNFAILNLIKTKSFKEDPNWIAKRLDISAKVAESSLERLLRCGLVKRSEDGKRLVRSQKGYATTSDIPNAWLKNSHSNTLNLAQNKLEELPVTLRDFSWITFPMSTARLSKAKELISNFQIEFMDLLGSQENEEADVFRMAVQLFPLTKIDLQ